MIRLGTRLAALVGVAVLVVGCSAGEGVDMGDGSSGSDSSGKTLTAAISGEPDKLDPQSTTSYNSFEVLENVFDTLVQPDEELSMTPALAESWTTSDDLLTWTFKLRSGVTWHDGSAFTAEDVVYSYNRIIDDKLSSSWRFSDVKEVKAVDDNTVEITVNSPAPNLLANIGGFKGVAIVQKANVESGEINTKPVGTGPFKLTSYTQGDSIDLVANEDYWGGAPKIGAVSYRFISEPSTALAALRSGEIQWTDQVAPQQVKALQDDSTIELGTVGSSDYWYIALNEAKKPWSDVKVRQAVAYAIDREAIITATKFGNATANQLAIPETSEWYTAYDKYSTDLDKAKKLMSDAGVSSATMTFLATPDYPETVTVGQLLADQLKQIGITVKITSVDFSTWLDEQGKGNFDGLMMGWLGNIDPADYYYSQHHSDGGNNFQSYSNATVDKLLDEGLVTTDTGERKKIYDEAATIIADECSYIYLYNPDVVQAFTPKLTGYTVRSDRAIRFDQAELSD